MNSKIFKSFTIIIIIFLQICNCTALIYDSDLEEESKSYLENVSIGLLDIVLITEDSSLSGVKKSLTNYILSKLSEVDFIILPKRLVTVNRDETSIVYNFNGADEKSDEILSDEYDRQIEEESESTEDKDEEETEDTLDEDEESTEDENESNDNENNNAENLEGDNQVNELNLTDDIEDYIFINIDEEPFQSKLPEVLGVDLSEIKDDIYTTYAVTKPEDTIKSITLNSDDFKGENGEKILGKVLNLTENILINILLEIKENSIEATIIVINNLFKQVIEKKVVNFKKLDFLFGEVDIKKAIWNEIKRILLGDNISTLEIRSNIKNSLVYIDDKFIGMTNNEDGKKYTFNLDVISSGSHKIRIVKENYHEVEGYIYLEKDKVSVLDVEMELLKSESSIIIYFSNEKMVDIWFDMDYIGTTQDDLGSPFIIKNAREGIHKIRAEKIGFNPYVIEVKVDGLNDKIINIKLSNYDKYFLDPDYRSEPYQYVSDILLYGTLISLVGTVSSFYEFNKYDDEKYNLTGSEIYHDVVNNYNMTRTWKDIFSYSTIILAIGTIAFKWIALEQRNVQIGYIIEPIISLNYNEVNSIMFGFRVGFNF